MKKLLGLALFLAAPTLWAQAFTPIYLSWQPYKQGATVPGGVVLGVKEEGGAAIQRSYINFLGAAMTCVDDGANDEVDCTIATAGTLPTVDTTSIV